MRIRLATIEKALGDVDRLGRSTSPRFTSQLKVARRIVEKSTEWLRFGMHVPSAGYPRLKALQERVIAEYERKEKEMLHDCQGCHEQWSGDYLREHPDQFEVEEGTKTVKGCPHCCVIDRDINIYQLPTKEEVQEFLTKAIERRAPGPLQNTPEGAEQLAQAAEEAVAETEEHFGIEFAANYPDSFTKRGEHRA